MTGNPRATAGPGSDRQKGPASMRGEPVRATDGSAYVRSAGTPLNVRWATFGLVALVAAALAGWLYMVQATKVAEQAHEVLLLEQTKQAMEHQVVMLEAQAARLGSLQRLRDEASQNGYTLPSAADSTARLYLDLPVVTASRASASAEPDSVTSEDSPWRTVRSVLASVGAWLDRVLPR